jgi:phosphoesterase RecJ-like protein
MDGDSLGSAVALWHALRALEKDPLIVINESVPRVFEFLVPEEAVRVVSSTEEAGHALSKRDLLVVVDNNAWSRLGYLEGPARTGELRVLCIDHHPSSELLVPDHLIDLEAAATGLMIHDLLESLGVALTVEMADAVYTSVVNDTGWFRNGNTDERALATCARLVAAGASPVRIDHEVNHRETMTRKRLLAVFLGTLNRVADGRLATGYVTAAMLAESGAAAEDTEDFIEHVRTLEGVRIAAFLREEPGGEVKLSLRTTAGCSALNIARVFGGGGHVPAAGAVHAGPLSAALEELEGAMRAELQRAREEGSSP